MTCYNERRWVNFMKKNTNKKDLFGKANYNEQVKSLVKISVVVIIVLAAVYFLTALATGEIKLGNSSNKEEEVTIQYEEILAGQVLNRKDKEYYVLLFEFSNENAGRYITLKDNYAQTTDALPLYLVDLEKGFNQKIVAEEDEKYSEKPSNIQDLKVNGTTLLKVKNGKVTDRIETDDLVKEFLSKIANTKTEDE